MVPELSAEGRSALVSQAALAASGDASCPCCGTGVTRPSGKDDSMADGRSRASPAMSGMPPGWMVTACWRDTPASRVTGLAGKTYVAQRGSSPRVRDAAACARGVSARTQASWWEGDGGGGAAEKWGGGADSVEWNSRLSSARGRPREPAQLRLGWRLMFSLSSAVLEGPEGSAGARFSARVTRAGLWLNMFCILEDAKGLVTPSACPASEAPATDRRLGSETRLALWAAVLGPCCLRLPSVPAAWRWQGVTRMGRTSGRPVPREEVVRLRCCGWVWVEPGPWLCWGWPTVLLGVAREEAAEAV